MIKSGESLEAVVDNLILGKKIKNVIDADDTQNYDDENHGKNDVSPRAGSGWNVTTQQSSGVKRNGTPGRSPR